MEPEYPDCCAIARPYALLFAGYVDPLDIIVSLKEDYGFTDKETGLIVNITGARLEDLLRFREAPNEEERRRIIMMRDCIKTFLHVSLTHQKIARWFRGQANYLHGKTPLQILAGGNMFLFMQAAHVYRCGIRGPSGTPPLKYKSWFCR